MKNILGRLLIVVAALVSQCLATQYYVSSSSGNDATGNGTQALPWQTFGGAGNHINSGSFSAGDVIYLKRGDTWNEPLIPPSSGTSASPIVFDAYGSGPAPVITAATPIAFVSGSWTYVAGSTWKATVSSNVSSPTVNLVQFGKVYGRKQPYGSGCSNSIVSKYDWCMAWPYIYVYSPAGANPVATYTADGSVVPIVAQASGLQMIYVNNKVWLTFQHIKVQSFDYVGVGVAGTSDNLVFANMEVDGMVPWGATPLGFYVNVASGSGTNIQFTNDDAHLNYDGFRVDAATAVAVKNCRGYANRDAGLRDNTASGTVVTYSYSHFYGNNVAQLPTSDILNGVAGSGNVSSLSAPVVTNFQTYPARFSFTVDDVGSSPGTETYINGCDVPGKCFLSSFSSRGIYFNTAVVPSYTVDWPSVNSWKASGNEIDSHSWSHQYYTTNTNPQNLTPYPNAPALDIQYTGSGTAATLTISGGMLSTSVTGATGDNIPSTNLANYTMQALHDYLVTLPHYTVTYDTSGPLVRPNTHSANLLSISNKDIKTASFVLLYDQTKLEPDEMASSKSAIQTNVPGLTETFYVYPDGIEDPTIEADALAAGYTAARGSLAMKGQDNATGSANSLYSNGVNVQNITSLGAIQLHGLTQAQINQMAASLVFRAAAWGVPYGFFTHYNSRGDNTPDISNTELGWLLDAVTASGGVWMTNGTLASAITSGSGFSGSTRYVQNPTGSPVNVAVAGANSPTVGTAAVASSYNVDLNGVNRSQLGAWDIGASAYLSQRYGTGSGAGVSRMGGSVFLGGNAQLPQNWANENEINPPGGTFDVTRTATTFAQVQQAICDWVAAPDQWWLVQVPHGTVIEANSTGYTCTQTGSSLVKQVTLLTKIVSGGMPTKFIVFDSDAPLLYGQTVCSHGITDMSGVRQPPSGDISTWWTGGNNGCADDIGSMWTLEGNWSPGNAGLLVQAGPWDPVTNIGPSHYAFRDAEFRPIPSLGGTSLFIANTDVGATGASQTMTSQMASHIHFMNIYGHADAKDWCPSATGTGSCVTSAGTGGPGNNQISTFMRLSNCAYCSLTYSYFDYDTRPGAEGHVVSIDETPGPVEVAHNWLSGSSSAVFTGGIAATDPFYSVSDLFVWQNRMTNPVSWVGSVYTGPGLVIKNRSEIKTCSRCLFEGNVAEYTDTSGAQQGQCFTENPRACSNSLQCDNYQVTIQDVSYTNNICRHALTGFTMVGRSGYPANGGGAASPSRRINVSNNLMYDLGNSGLYDPLNTIPFPYGMRTQSGGQGYICNGTNASGTITLSCAGGPTGLLQTAISPGDPLVVTGCSDATWNTPGGNFMTQRGAQALPGTNANGTTVVYANPGAVSPTATGCIVQNFQGFPASLTFAHNTVVMQTTGGGKNNGRMYNANTVNVMTDTGCTGAGPVHMTAITALSRAGGIVTAAVASTSGWPTGLTSSGQTIVEVLNSGDFSGTFYYLGQSGGNVQWLQSGASDETGTTLGTAQQMGTCPANMFAQNNTWKNNLLAFDLTSAPSCPNTPATGWTGWLTQGGSNVEGCQSTGTYTCSELAVDPTNSVVTNTDFPGRCGAKYMEIGGTNANAMPPVTLTFPASTVCAGPAADGTCVGIKGMMNGSAFDGNDPNYHNYALVASSPYKAAGISDSDDNTDMGADIGALDTALTRLDYPCTGCGTGPKGEPPKIEILAPGAGTNVAAVNMYLKPSPYINGIVYSLWWACSDQDGTAAHYTWTNFDNQVMADGWAAAGKKIHVVLGGVTYGGSDSICYGGTGWGTSGVGNYGVPAYVWSALGPSNYVSCTCNGGTQQIPNYFNAAYLNNYQNWIAATLAHLASAPYASSIGYVRVAWGKGGETTPISSWDAVGTCPDGGGKNTLTNDWGYTLSGWESFLQNGMQFEAGLGSPLQLMISITPMGPSGGSQAAVPNFTAPIAASLHIGFGTQGLMASDVNNLPGCGGNWCNLFATYTGQVPLETQTFYQSCATSNESGTCPSMAVTTGTLDPLLIWAARAHATTFEMYYEDACAMLCPGYNVAGYAAYPQPGYVAAMANAVGGNY